MQFGIPVYIGHLLAYDQTSWVGSILVIFSTLVTIGVAVYLYREFRSFKSRHDRLNAVLPDLEQGETEFEIAPAMSRTGFGKAGGPEQTALVSRTSDDDDLFFDEDEDTVQ